MEDVLYYIGLGLLIIFSLIRKAGQATAQKSKKTINPPMEAPMENFPPIIPTFAHDESVDNQASRAERYGKRADLENSAEAQSLETIFDEEELYEREQARKAKRAEQTQGQVKKAPKQIAHPTLQKPSQQHKEAQKGGNSENLADFDLQKAVIYSEILKPKFEE